MRNPWLPIPVRIDEVTTENDARDLKTFKLSFATDTDRKAFTFTPGQFGFVSLSGIGEAPFGIASAPHEERVWYTVKRVGVFTTALHEIAEGAVIGMRGPFGNCYPFELMKGRDVVIVSGGFSFTTLRSTLVHMLRPERRKDFGRLTVIYGARSPGELLYKDELRAWERAEGLRLILCVDRLDGAEWPRTEGLVPKVLGHAAPDSSDAVALVCGPPIMLKFTHPVLKKLGFPPDRVFLSLENRMKCGIGQCGHCSIGDRYVCKDGPVFSYQELLGLPPEY